MKCNFDFDQRPKDLVSYGDLAKSIEEYRNYGNPKYRGLSDSINKKSLKVSKHFGLFLTFLAMSAQRNTTVREMKFKDFYKKDGKNYLHMYASKTKKPAEYIISPVLQQMVASIENNVKN